MILLLQSDLQNSLKTAASLQEISFTTLENSFEPQLVSLLLNLNFDAYFKPAITDFF